MNLPGAAVRSVWRRHRVDVLQHNRAPVVDEYRHELSSQQIFKDASLPIMPSLNCRHDMAFSVSPISRFSERVDGSVSRCVRSSKQAQILAVRPDAVPRSRHGSGHTQVQLKVKPRTQQIPIIAPVLSSPYDRSFVVLLFFSRCVPYCLCAHPKPCAKNVN